MRKLSVIVLSYNTKDITEQCLNSLLESLEHSPLLEAEIVIVDNNSSDGSQEMIVDFESQIVSDHVSITTIFNKENVGFGAGNNIALKEATGDLILFLNSDVLIDRIDWIDLVEYMEREKNVGALTVRLGLKSGKIDPASHRGFPTLWNSFCYYSKLESITRGIPVLNKIFGGYHLTYKDLAKVHEIDSPSGAFFLTRKTLMDELKGFDEKFFMYGEDLDLAFRIKEKGYKIVYYPKHHVTHLKYQSGLKTTHEDTQSQTKNHFYDAMKIFYKKHYASQHPSFINNVVYSIIDLKSRL